ncbi:hypothetical protein GCM10023149_35350 [Mucilaginibacter gynuensis]|uniref:DoxX family protein n=1 Tax=Mucilaginibacter gynuensis TaxID=1302236 RepID=A0ABP8GUS1_9SPHI
MFAPSALPGAAKPVYYTLRVAVAMCFIGHGAFGIITKAVWCNYFAVFGIDAVTAYKLMPLVGTVDILMGISMLVYPTRAIALWLVIWGLFTASLRPASGEPFAEMIERAGNYGAPLALLLLCGMQAKFKTWFTFIQPPGNVAFNIKSTVGICLRVAAFLLLSGHGWLNLLHKKTLIGQYTGLGFQQANTVATVAGITEIVAAILILIRPSRGLLFAFLIWKIGTELLYPNHLLFEWVERGGSYGTLLALWFICAPAITAQNKAGQAVLKPVG